jgi:hypothetical protein
MAIRRKSHPALMQVSGIVLTIRPADAAGAIGKERSA